LILNKIKLEDFISHKKTELDLGFGINVVVGPNGAGKTSILDGISFALFNDYSNRGKKQNLINSRGSRCKVGLAFTEGGVGYDVEWSLEKRGSAHGSFFRTVDGKRILLAKDGERSVAKEIEKVLGIDKSMFMQSIYVRQGEIEQLVDAKPAERKALISRLLGVEDLEKAWSSIKDVIEVYRDRQLVLEGELSRKSEFEEQRDKAETKSKELEILLSSKRDELNKLESGVKSLQAIMDELDAKKKDFDNLDRERGILEQKIKNLEDVLKTQQEELRKASTAAEVVNKLRDDVEKLPILDSYVSSLLEKERQELKLSGLNEKLAEIAELDEILKQNAESHRLYLEKEKLVAEKSLQRKEYEGCPKALDSARKQLDKCEKEEKKRKENLASELNKCSNALGQPVTLSNLQAILKETVVKVQEKIKELDKRLSDTNGEIGVLNQRGKELDDNLSKFSSDTEVKACPTCDTELLPERVKQLIEKFSSEKDNSRDKMVALQKALQQAEEEREQALENKKQVDNIDPERLKILEAELDETITEIANEKSEIEKLEAQTKLLSKLDKELELLEGEKRDLEGASKDFELAKRRQEKMISSEEIESQRQPLLTKLEDIDAQLKLAIEELGGVPEDPEEDLVQLRKKKEEYDQNVQVAKRQLEFESAVTSTTKELDGSTSMSSKNASLIEELGYDEKLHETKRKELDRLKDEVKELSVFIAAKEQEKIGEDDNAKKCRDELRALEAKAAEKKLVSKYVKVLNDIRYAYSKDGIQKLIRAKAKPVLEKATRDLFERFNLAYSDVRIDDNYNISVIGSSGEQDIDQISGGERVALAIALRLAIAQVLSGRIETVIMDEPTTHLDEERRKELVNILNSFFREGGRIIPQMLIITHHSEIEEVADVVYSVKKKDGYSTIEAAKLVET
jgi:exonuclease SbcC